MCSADRRGLALEPEPSRLTETYRPEKEIAMDTDTQEVPSSTSPQMRKTARAAKGAQPRARSAEPGVLAPASPKVRSYLPQHSSGAARLNVGRGERVASGVLGAMLLAAGARRPSTGSVASGLVGGALLYRAWSGHCHVYQALHVTSAHQAGTPTPQGNTDRSTVQRTITIARSPAELHDLWREPQTFERIMAFFAQAHNTGDGATRWTMRTPLNKVLTWETRIVEDVRGEHIRWETSGDSAFRSSGSIRFAPASGNRGTLATLELRFEPPGGALGNAAAKILRIVPATMAFKALQRFKNLAETGEIATADDQVSGRPGHGFMGTAQPDAQERNIRVQHIAARGLGWFSIALGLSEVIAPGGLARVTGMPDRPALTRVFGLREILSGVGILSDRRRDLWLWARVAGDAMDLALLGSALASPRGQRNRIGVATAAVLGVTILDAVVSVRERLYHPSPDEVARGMSAH
jgi:uncharacterized membrane protein